MNIDPKFGHITSAMYTIAQIHDIANEWRRQVRQQERRLLAQRQKRDAKGRFAA